MIFATPAQTTKNTIKPAIRTGIQEKSSVRLNLIVQLQNVLSFFIDQRFGFFLCFRAYEMHNVSAHVVFLYIEEFDFIYIMPFLTLGAMHIKNISHF
jgi:hypothetical protein